VWTLVTKEYDSLAAEAKNVAAGAVLVSAVGAVVVGVLILGLRCCLRSRHG